VIALDAGVLIAHLSPAGAHRETATRLLVDTADQGLVAHSLTVAEVLVGAARVGRAREMRDDLEALGVQVADRLDDDPLRLAELRASTGLRLPDCCVLLTAATSCGATLATFDRALARVAAQHEIRVVT
jgi:predicted nucleic acid-binding protein